MFEVESCVRGFHVYGALWSPRIGENLQCAREPGNREDPFAVAVKNSSGTVGHVPRKVSCICSFFLRHGGSITCTVKGNRRRSEDLPQGGLEIPCLLTFDGPEEIVDKVRKRFGEVERRQATSADKLAVTTDDRSKDCAQGSDNGAPTTKHDHKSQEVQFATIIKEEAKVEVERAREEPKKESEPPTSLTIWLQFNDMVLTENDKHTIESGKCLADQHMNFAQRLLKHQFPKINGLRLTLLQEQSHSLATSNAVQLLHIKANHWIVACTKEKGKVVRVYDSMYSSIDQATAKLIQTNFHCSMLNIRLMSCQKQVGAVDCGLFAIALATSIAFGDDPSTRRYSQEKMRSHLLTCFQNQHLELFP